MKYTAPIKRVDTAKGHKYLDANRAQVPGVTTIIGDGVPKPALINWAANTTADYAVDRWDELSDMTPSVRLKALKDARYAEKDAAANRGTAVHALAEHLVKGEEVTVPDELVGHVEAYVRFLDEFAVEPLYVEATTISYKHGYAGTLDLICRVTLPDGSTPTWLCDIKTNRSGIFGETALQLAGYRWAEILVPEGSTEEQPMPAVDGCAAIHVRGDGYSLIPVTAEREQHRQLLYAQQVGLFSKGSRDLVGAPVEPPTTSSYRLTRSDQ